MDTTDRQAVTVAQEDREAAADLMEKLFTGVAGLESDLDWANTVRAGEDDEYPTAQAFARHRLASVSSASAETGCYQAKFRALLIEAGRNAGAFISDSASDEFLELIPEEVRLKVERLTASPEPVPATNQAGEVERLVEVAIKADPSRTHRDYRLNPIYEEEREQYRPAVAAILAALATQPAKSQEVHNG